MIRNLAAAVVLGAASTTAFAIEPFQLPWANHPDGRDVRYSTADHPNGVFVMEFLANYCGACNANAENVDELATQYAGEPRVQVLDVSLDSSDREIATWIRNHRPNHPVLKDVGRAVWRQVGAQYIPTVVITNCRGEEKFRHTAEWTATAKAEIRGVIDGLLAETCE